MKRIPMEHPAKLCGGVKREQVLLLKHINAAASAGNTERAEQLRARLRELDAKNRDRRKVRLKPNGEQPITAMTERQLKRLESIRLGKQERANSNRLSELTKKSGTCP